MALDAKLRPPRQRKSCAKQNSRGIRCSPFTTLCQISAAGLLGGVSTPFGIAVAAHAKAERSGSLPSCSTSGDTDKTLSFSVAGSTCTDVSTYGPLV